MMRVAFVFVLGFTQTTGSAGAGLVRAWRNARRFASPDRFVARPYQWNSAWKGEAQLLKDLDPEHVVAFGYSWGCGWGLRQLTRFLDRPIDEAVLVDPVYRSPWLPAAIPVNPLSMSSFGKVKLPGVISADVFLQRNRRPFGRKVTGPERVNYHQLDDATHNTIDDHPAIAAKIAETLERWS